MRKLAAAVLLVSLSLFGCAQTPPSNVAEGDGPQNVQTTPPEVEPTDTAPQSAAFGEKIAYPDGLVVEVIRIREAKLSLSGMGSDGLKTGQPYTVLSVRITNGTDEVVSADASAAVSYGPDGEPAETVVDQGLDSVSGRILPGKAKTGTYGFVVPDRYESDVVLEFAPDFAHEPAIFTGSIS